jgi:hypothetical protein
MMTQELQNYLTPEARIDLEQYLSSKGFNTLTPNQSLQNPSKRREPTDYI